MIIIGLFMATLGTIFINIESFYTNLKFNSKEKSKENSKKPEKTELIDINDKIILKKIKFKKNYNNYIYILKRVIFNCL